MFYALYNDSVKWNLSFCLAVKFKCHSKLFQKWCSSGVVGAFLFRKTIDFTGFSGTFQDTAMGYWKTDLTAFVNLWDTMDDRICSLIAKDHIELGGYTLGKIGAINKSKGFIGNIPKFHKMCMELHCLRLQSHLSHSEIRSTHQYTGPIPQSKRKTILKLIDEGIRELIQFW